MSLHVPWKKFLKWIATILRKGPESQWIWKPDAVIVSETQDYYGEMFYFLFSRQIDYKEVALDK